MPFCRFEPTLHSHPKLVALSDQAFRVWACSVSFSLANLTDGALPDMQTARNPLRLSLGMTPRSFQKVAQELITAGLWEANGRGLRVHDYEDYQPSKREVEDEREANRERARRWREKRGANVVSNDVSTDQVTKPVRPSVRTSPPYPPKGGVARRREDEVPYQQPPRFKGRCEECDASSVSAHADWCSKEVRT